MDAQVKRVRRLIQAREYDVVVVRISAFSAVDRRDHLADIAERQLKRSPDSRVLTFAIHCNPQSNLWRLSFLANANVKSF
jgi:hypothetical protein